MSWPESTAVRQAAPTPSSALSTILGYSSTRTRIPLVYVNLFFRRKRVSGEMLKPYLHHADQDTDRWPSLSPVFRPRCLAPLGATAVPTSLLTLGYFCLFENFAHTDWRGAQISGSGSPCPHGGRRWVSSSLNQVLRTTWTVTRVVFGAHGRHGGPKHTAASVCRPL